MLSWEHICVKTFIIHGPRVEQFMQAQISEPAVKGDLALDELEFPASAPGLFISQITVKGKIIEIQFMVRRLGAP